MACRLSGAEPLSEPMLEQISMKFVSKTSIFIQENAFENVVRKMAAILSRPRCVNSIYTKVKPGRWLPAIMNEWMARAFNTGSQTKWCATSLVVGSPVRNRYTVELFLTHRCRVTHTCVRKPWHVNIGPDNGYAPSHYLNQCWIVVNRTLVKNKNDDFHSRKLIWKINGNLADCWTFFPV